MTTAAEDLMRIIAKVIEASPAERLDILKALAVLRRYYLREGE